MQLDVVLRRLAALAHGLSAGQRAQLEAYWPAFVVPAR